MKRFAILGCGHISGRHAQQISRLAVLEAVCDTDEDKAKALAAQFGAKYYLSPEEMLAQEPDLDIVSICTPNHLHARHTILCLNAGKHVLCEKPLSINAGDAREMLETARQAGKKLFVVKQNRYNPPVELVKSLLEENKLGRIHSFQINGFWNRPARYYENSWKGRKETDGGTLFTQFSHFIDLLYWLLGDVETVKALTTNAMHPRNDIEDCGVVLMKLCNGAIGTMNYNVTSFEKNMEGSITLFGDRGTVKIGGQYLNTLEYQNIEGHTAVVPATGNPANDYGYYQGSMSNHSSVYEELLKSIDKEDTHTLAGAFDGLKTVQIIESIYQSANNIL